MIGIDRHNSSNPFSLISARPSLDKVRKGERMGALGPFPDLTPFRVTIDASISGRQNFKRSLPENRLMVAKRSIRVGVSSQLNLCSSNALPMKVGIQGRKSSAIEA